MNIQVKTTELTKNIVKQLDWARETHFNNPNTKPFCRVETSDNNLVILETVTLDLKGFEEKEYTKITYSTYWNTGISRHFQQKYNIKEVYDIPKAILLK